MKENLMEEYESFVTGGCVYCFHVVDAYISEGYEVVIVDNFRQGR